MFIKHKDYPMPSMNAEDFQDIAVRNAIEAEVQKAKAAADRVKNQFLANITHEIRTPMNGIIGLTELALDTDLTGEQREYLEMVKQSADTLLSMLNDILDYAMMETGKAGLEVIDFDVHELVKTTVETLVSQADRKGLKLLCRIRPEVPAILKGDPRRLRQVIIHLVGNGIKFTERGEVALEIGEDKSEIAGPGNFILHVTVRDTGIGISPDKIDVIFDSFTQGDGSLTRRYGGAGLGLALSRRNVEIMGGRVWVESTPGRGSIFNFSARFARGKSCRNKNLQNVNGDRFSPPSVEQKNP